MTIKQQIEADLRAAFVKLNFAPEAAVISVSTQDICDYQCNACFALGKQFKKPPRELAAQIAAAFKSAAATAEAHPSGFLNFRVTDAALTDTAERIVKTSRLPMPSCDPNTVFFDYGGANVAKETHVGHLRPAIVGEALKRVYKALGHKTVSDVYFGDWGLQMGLVIAQLDDEGFIANGKFVKEVTLDTFNTLYPRASKRKDAEPDFRARAEQITLEIQQKSKPNYDLYLHIREISVAKLNENYKEINCTFDLSNGESTAAPYVDEVIELLVAKGAYENKNALIMDIAEPADTGPMPPVILKKHNGGDLYATSDIATIYYRYKDFKPSEFIYVADARQELHFKQVFRCVKKGGLVPPATKFTHVAFGTMNGTDGKPFKTRAGGTIKFGEVINLVTQAAAARLRENGKAANPALARKIGISALKFADLSNHVRKDYIFDIDKFTSFEGKTGPYLLYTVARINSVLKRMQNAKCKMQNNSEIKVDENTRNLLVKVLKLADSYPAAAQNYTLNGLADAAYALAQAFNLFYANVKLLDSPYLPVAVLVKTALTFALDTLAIDTVDKM